MCVIDIDLCASNQASDARTFAIRLVHLCVYRWRDLASGHIALRCHRRCEHDAVGSPVRTVRPSEAPLENRARRILNVASLVAARSVFTSERQGARDRWNSVSTNVFLLSIDTDPVFISVPTCFVDLLSTSFLLLLVRHLLLEAMHLFLVAYCSNYCFQHVFLHVFLHSTLDDFGSRRSHVSAEVSNHMCHILCWPERAVGLGT